MQWRGACVFSPDWIRMRVCVRMTRCYIKFCNSSACHLSFVHAKCAETPFRYNIALNAIQLSPRQQSAYAIIILNTHSFGLIVVPKIRKRYAFCVTRINVWAVCRVSNVSFVDGNAVEKRCYHTTHLFFPSFRYLSKKTWRTQNKGNE